jgi:hypothetical protein
MPILVILPCDRRVPRLPIVKAQKRKEILQTKETAVRRLLSKIEEPYHLPQRKRLSRRRGARVKLKIHSGIVTGPDPNRAAVSSHEKRDDANKSQSKRQCEGNPTIQPYLRMADLNTCSYL